MAASAALRMSVVIRTEKRIQAWPISPGRRSLIILPAGSMKKKVVMATKRSRIFRVRFVRLQISGDRYNWRPREMKRIYSTTS